MQNLYHQALINRFAFPSTYYPTEFIYYLDDKRALALQTNDGREIEDVDGKHSEKVAVPPEQDGVVDLADMQVALLKLPDEQREALLLVTASDLSYEDAASQLGMSKSTVKRAFDELQTVGFIALMRQGVWYGRKASEWRVTFENTEGHPATHEWKAWQAPHRRNPPKKIKPRYPNGIPACFDGAEPVPGAT